METSNTTQRVMPTVGRIVHYHLNLVSDRQMARFNTNEKPDPMAAIIVGIDTAERVNLMVFDANAGIHQRLGVRLRQAGDDKSKNAYCEWPPVPATAQVKIVAEAIPITKAQLHQAMLAWETAYRNGETIPLEEAAAMSIEEVSANCTTHLWKALGGLT